MTTTSEKKWESEFGVIGLAHKFFRAAENRGRGFTKAQLNTLAENPGMLRDFHDFFTGRAKIVPFVYLDDDPFVPDGCEVVEHRKGGLLEFDPAKVTLFLSENQKGDKRIRGDDLSSELKDRPVFNANLLDWYLAHSHLISEEWKDKSVFFWGTIYRDVDGRLYVRYLCWLGESWYWRRSWLGDFWYFFSPTAVPALL